MSPATPGSHPLLASIPGVVEEVRVAVGDSVVVGQPVVVIESMKMEHVVIAEIAGIVRSVAVRIGEQVGETDPLAFIEPSAITDASPTREDEPFNADEIRPDLAELLERKRRTLDEGRPTAVSKRHAVGHRTARENIGDLVDPGSLVEYGPLVLAAQRERRTHEELIELTPADGLVAGLASVNGDAFDARRSAVMVLAYDWTVFAGTQGVMAHKKIERLLSLAERLRRPLVIFAEGGGGRPGDTRSSPAGLDMMTFVRFARLSGLVPTIGIVGRFCFAGNAALLGCCDVIIATEDANIGMGGPAMIAGGALGEVEATSIGPISSQSENGVVDVVVADDAAAVAAAKRYLSYFQGPVREWTCSDQRLLRQAIPENRRRAYDVRKVVDQLADVGSVLELRAAFGAGMVTALIRIEGVPVGVVANNPLHLGGAIDADAADKAARFMQLCDAYDLPIVALCDTPGFMVGPDAEERALVRHASRLFVTAANIRVPMFAIVLRKAYGLGAQGAVGGSFHAPVFIVSWPTGEFGGMGLEGYVQLAFRRELDAIADPVTRRAEYERLVADRYDRGRALSMAEHFEIDDVIDPAESRAWIVSGLMALPLRDRSAAPKPRPNLDTW